MPSESRSKLSRLLRTWPQGAYVRTGDTVERTGSLYAIEEQMKLPVLAWGETTLQMTGYAHEHSKNNAP